MSGFTAIGGSVLLVAAFLTGNVIHSALATISKTDSGDPLVETNSGPVIGKMVKSSGKKLSAFLGIPFAKPPLNELRFRYPEPVEPWSDPLVAKNFGTKCASHFEEDLGYKAEDCLYLNVWTPANVDGKPPSDPLPVMVWIYGGGFVSGSADFIFYDGEAVAAHGNVVFASFNYRVGFFGFLFANNTEAPGNQGLHDMALAIKWIHENIHHFGGDPNQITLYGQSAGAMSVGYLMLSPFTRHIMKRTILMSGTSTDALSGWLNNAQGFRIAENFANEVGCTNDGKPLATREAEAISCLRNLNQEAIEQAQDKLIQMDVFRFTPPICGDDLLPDNPSEAIKKSENLGPQLGEVLMGLTANEGALFMPKSFPERFDDDLGVTGPPLTVDDALKMLHRKLPWILSPEDVREIFKFYEDKGKPRGQSVESMFMDGLSDLFFVCGALKTADYLVAHGKTVYFYLYNHSESTMLHGDWMGPTHFDDVPPIFGANAGENNALGNRMMSTWEHFAKTG